MQAMQAKILTAIKHMIEEHPQGSATAGRYTGYEAVQHRDYANTGTVYAQTKGDFNTDLSVRYQFDRDSCTIHISGPLVDLGYEDNPPAYRVSEQGRVSFHALNYDDGERIRTMLRIISDSILGKNSDPTLHDHIRTARNAR